MTLEDELDPTTARQYFGLPGGALPETLIRRVLTLTGTGVEFSTMTTDERAVLSRWALILGSHPPPRSWSEVTVTRDMARDAARQAANLLAQMEGDGDVALLARRLLPGDRPPVVVLTALGFRVYEGADRVVDGDDFA